MTGFFRGVLATAIAAAALGPGITRAAPVDAAGSNAAHAVSVPGFTSGPTITRAGLVWMGAGGQMLTSHTRTTRLLPGGGAFVMTSATSDWAAAPRAGGVAVGRLGGRLRPLASLRGCPPLTAMGASPTSAGSPLLALAGTTLYAVVDSRCLHRRGAKRWALVAVNLRTGVRRLLEVVAPGAVGLAAAGARVAVTYSPDGGPAPSGQDTPIAVVVLDAARGRRAYSMRAPLPARRDATLKTEIDPQGDVLVTSTVLIPPAPQSSGWWATPADPAGHELSSLLTAGRAVSRAASGSPQLITGAATLSAGRIAYATEGSHSEAREERIELLDLRSGSRREVADFLGVVGVVGVDLSGEELAWAQQSTIPEGSRETDPGGGSTFRCQVLALGAVELTSVDLRRLKAMPLRVGPPLPAADRPPCTDFES